MIRTEIKNKYQLVLWLLVVLGITFSCSSQKSDSQERNSNSKVLFELIPSSSSGLTFNNKIVDSEDFNYFIYDGMYQGAGVGVGDFNNDGLTDIFFAGNQVDNKLYINKGDFKFEDQTQKAGVAASGSWCTGVALADVNADGWLDIYVCRFLYHNRPDLTSNLLYINNGDGTFTEKAKEYGIADPELSVTATFFDYDRDGDLDLFVVNQPPNSREHRPEYLTRDLNFVNSILKEGKWSSRLYRNEGNRFTDVTRQAGMINFGYGLAAVAGDLDGDGWDDLYEAFDYEGGDKLYMNQQNGTFRDEILGMIRHTSNFSMGTDIADFNNDGYLDVYVADMLAQDNFRQKANMGGMDPLKFWALVETGQHYQYMRNCLQLNNGNGTFSEIAQLAGVDKTDWSWATLFGDFDGDGWKDLLVTNGIKKDVRNKDFLNQAEQIVEQRRAKLLAENSQLTFIPALDLVNSAPSTKLTNYLFKNNKDLTFTNVAKQWGLDQVSFSHGAAYADFDNDGDLDLVMSNMEEAPFLYRNLSNSNWLQIKLEGSKTNPNGFGTKAIVKQKQGLQFQQYTPFRGYMSSMLGNLHFGLADQETVEKLEIIWPDGKSQTFENVKSNQVLTVRHSEATISKPVVYEEKYYFEDITQQTGIDFIHRENSFDDFEKEILLPHKMSQFGPGIAVGDVDGDGLDDFFVSGAAGQAGVIYRQISAGKFKRHQSFEADKAHEDLGALFFDADSDNDLDLYVASGGNEFKEGNPLLQDRLYLNQKGIFTRTTSALPELKTSTATVSAADFDADGDLDLFVGGRVTVGLYPTVPNSYLLLNEKGKFSVVNGLASGIEKIGMVCSALWSDYNSDGKPDLILAGEWMPITVFRNDGGRFSNQTVALGLDKTNGLWNSIVGADLDNDQDIDYIVGNYGLNSKFTASIQYPFHVYANDFDKSGTLDIVLAYYLDGQCYPVRGRQCSSQQMPALKKKFPTYTSFASSDLYKIYDSESLGSSIHHQAYSLSSTVFINNGNGFEPKPLPTEAQFSSVYGFWVEDFDSDGLLDVVLGGNFYAPEVETGRQDASIGLMLKGKGDGNFAVVPNFESGIFIPEDVKSMAVISRGEAAQPMLLVGNNNGKLQAIAPASRRKASKTFVSKQPYLTLDLPNGRKRKVEFYKGSGFLSQSSSVYSLPASSDISWK
jgi:hypothetical protein